MKKTLVPRRNEKPVMGLRTGKNFITANAVEAILSVPQMPRTSGVDYLSKEDYGKVPDYLNLVKTEIRRENEMIDEYVNRQMNTDNESSSNELYSEFGEQQRYELILKLKTKWDAVNAVYQKSCHRVKFESRGDINRKESQENELKRLENDIMLLQRGGPLMVSE